MQMEITFLHLNSVFIQSILQFDSPSTIHTLTTKWQQGTIKGEGLTTGNKLCKVYLREGRGAWKSFLCLLGLNNMFLKLCMQKWIFCSLLCRGQCQSPDTQITSVYAMFLRKKLMVTRSGTFFFFLVHNAWIHLLSELKNCDKCLNPIRVNSCYINSHVNRTRKWKLAHKLFYVRQKVCYFWNISIFTMMQCTIQFVCRHTAITFHLSDSSEKMVRKEREGSGKDRKKGGGVLWC